MKIRNFICKSCYCNCINVDNFDGYCQECYKKIKYEGNNMSIINKIKHCLWQIGIVKNCPDCGSQLQEMGYPDEDFVQYYKCSNQNCNFGKPNNSKV